MKQLVYFVQSSIILILLFYSNYFKIHRKQMWLVIFMFFCSCICFNTYLNHLSINSETEYTFDSFFNGNQKKCDDYTRLINTLDSLKKAINQKNCY